MNARAVALLEVQGNERILDLGFGGGLGLDLLLARAAHVVGIDRASDMVAAGRKQRAADIAAGRLELLEGDVQALPLPDGCIDGVVTVNTVYFWPDLAAAFAEIRRVLTPGGRIVIGIRDGAVMTKVSPDVFTLRAPADIGASLTAAGFEAVRVVSPEDQQAHFIVARAMRSSA